MSDAWHDASGNRFKPGNPGGGRKPRETERHYLELMRACVTEKDWREVVARALSDAKRGDAQGRKFIADYLLGAPVQRIAPTTPDGENEYHGIDLDQLTDGDIAQLAAIATRLGTDTSGTPAT